MDAAGRAWGGKTVNLGLGGLKAESDAPLDSPHQVQLSLNLPDGGPDISVVSLMGRRDSNGLAFAFMNLERSALDRIRTFVNYLLPRQPLKVLIVEDDPSLAEVFSDFVRDEGHETLVAASAEAGLELIDRFYPDALIVDLYLPGMSGLELIRLLADQRRLLPSIVVSGAASAEDARESLRLGVLDLIPKPVSLPYLQTMLSLLEAQVANLRLANEAGTS
jgi:CheY-like chemotaxis protein